MTKNNSIAIAIAILALVLTTTANAQRTIVTKKQKPSRNDIIKPIQVIRQEMMIDGMMVDGPVVKITGGKFSSQLQTSRSRQTANFDEADALFGANRQTAAQVTHDPDFENIRQMQDVFVTEIKSPRDVATGQASGRRQHQPLAVQDDRMGNFEIQRIAKPGRN